MLEVQIPADLDAKYQAALQDWSKNDKVARLWKRDPSLWTSADESNWMGWLDVVDQQLADIQVLLDLQHEIKQRGYKHAVLLGMGGSSLSPEVTAFTFGKQAGFPELLILDSTNPAQIRDLETKFDYRNTVFVVASKSGSTLEPNIFKQYFCGRAQEEIGVDAAKHFIAITDPGSKMQSVAERDKFWHIFFGLASIGGRYSALSNFGMVPAAIAGVDVRRILEGAKRMVEASKRPAAENPAVMLGCLLGAPGNAGHDKVTAVASPGISDFGAWMEQLIAESTGKIGKGLIPVDREPLGPPTVYGKDRVFAHMRLSSDVDPSQESTLAELASAGNPVVRIDIKDIYEIGAEYFRWEIATAVAGSILGVNPFDQPDVEASKIATRALTSEYEAAGALPQEKVFFADGAISLFTDEANASALKSLATHESLAGYVHAHLSRLRDGDYFALLAYIQMSGEHESALQMAREAVRDTKRVATCLGFGPRFLHSTGQAYKGGPNSGVFLQITCDHPNDLPVPGQKYTFGVVQNAQARGDFQVLSDRKRRALRVHLSGDPTAGLTTLTGVIKEALKG
ncbi:MAG: hypothetical protein NVS9B15_00560 [Acidobacteriaceae bacterium]